MAMCSRGLCLFRPGVLTVAMTTVIFYVWSIIAMIDPQNITAISAEYALFKTHIGVGLAFLFGAVCSTIAIVRPSLKPIKNLCLFMPQQFLLLLSAIGVFNCMIQKQFSDGVTRPLAFILADQMWIVILCYCHMIAIISASDRLPPDIVI